MGWTSEDQYQIEIKVIKDSHNDNPDDCRCLALAKVDLNDGEGWRDLINEDCFLCPQDALTAAWNKTGDFLKQQQLIFHTPRRR